MKAWTVCRREMGAAFDSPIAYVVLALLPAVAAAIFMVIGSFFQEGVASMRGFFAGMPWLLIMVVPATTMRMWAEERRNGTEELLVTYPFRLRDLVVGKFLGAWGLLALSLIASLGVPITVAMLGKLDWGPVVGGYVGTLLLGAASVSVGLFLSACTRNQVVAWLLAVVILLFFNLIGMAATATSMPPTIGKALLAVDFGHHFRSISRGVIDLRDVLFYVLVVAFFLSMNGLALERRRWG